MLVRRGMRPRLAPRDLPFPPDLDRATADRVCEQLAHYAFRLFLRGAILAAGPFRPQDATRYLPASKARELAEELVAIGLAAPAARGRFRLLWPAKSFGGLLEWWVGREIRRRLDCDVVTGVQSGAAGVDGDLDVVAAAEGKLFYIELKSSPPKHVTSRQVAAFLRRVRAVRPSVAVFAVDTALRLADKVLPMLAKEISAGDQPFPKPHRLSRENWELTPHLFSVNARQDFVDNICSAIAHGLLSLSPKAP